MGWITVEPEPRVKLIRVRMSHTKLKADGKWYADITFGDVLMRQFGELAAPTCSIMADPDAKRLCVRFGEGGHELRRFKKGGAGFQIRSLSWFNQVEMDSTGCQVESIDADTRAVVFNVPEYLTSAAVRVAAKAPVVAQDTSGDHKSVNGDGKTSIVDYLKRKGYKASKLAGDWYMINGERIPKVQAVQIVNKNRTAAELPALRLDQCE